MALTDADKTFLAATASLDPKRDRKAILSAWREAYGDAATDVPDKGAWYRIRQLQRNDEVKDYLDQQSAIADAARGQGVAERNKAIFKKQAALEDLERAMIQSLTAVLDGSDPAEKGAAIAKAAEAAVKVLSRQSARPAVDPAMVAARAARRKQIEAQLAAEEAANGGPQGSPQEAPAIPLSEIPTIGTA